MKNKPFLLSPSYKNYLWGGRRLKDEYNKSYDTECIAESWECSTHPEGESAVASGNFEGISLSEVLKTHPEFMGSHPKTESELPILVKLIDASKDLSVQVHPSDEYASANEDGQRGKTEMWYVLDAKEGARLTYGFKEDIDEATVRKAVEDKNIVKYLRKIPVRKDDIFFVEAGTVHAIGEGILIAEVQENSNLIYRIFDYDRTDSNGHKRELHIDKAMAVANLKAGQSPRQPMRVLHYKPGMASEVLCRCNYFEVNRLLINTEETEGVSYASDALSFRVLLCIDGEGRMEFDNESLLCRKGDCVFVPADSTEIMLYGCAKFLDIRG